MVGNLPVYILLTASYGEICPFVNPTDCYIYGDISPYVNPTDC